MVSKISWSFIQLLFLMFDAGARDEQYPEQVSTNHVPYSQIAPLVMILDVRVRMPESKSHSNIIKVNVVG